MSSGCIGTDPQITWQVAPTGGIVILKLKSAAPANTWVLIRQVISESQGLVHRTALFDAPSLIQPVYLDIGDGTKGPLDPTCNYQYTFTTSAGTAIAGPILPSASIQIEPDHLTSILLRALASGLRSLVIPAEFNDRPRVFHAMPMGSQPTLPMVSLNDTLLQQGDIPIGQNNPNNIDTNTLVIGGQATRHFTIAVLTSTVEERLFYRDAVLAIFNAILGPIAQAIGENSSHRFQVNSSQVAQDGMNPGFYFAEILLELTGTFSVGVSTTYGLIEEIDGYDQSGLLFIDTSLT